MEDVLLSGQRYLVEIRDEMPYKDARRYMLERFEYTYLRLLLERCGGNLSAASRASNLSRKHIRTLMDRYGMRKRDSEDEETS